MLLLILTWVVSHFRGGIIMIRPRQGGVEREVLGYLTCGLLVFAALQYSEAQHTNSASCSVSGPTCYSKQVYYNIRKYTAYNQIRYTYSSRCGWWGRCRYTAYYRGSYTAYSQGAAYRQISSCCSGYSGSPGSCTPICSGGNACQNGGVCVRPNTCCCAKTGYSGPVCNIGMQFSCL
ncbi:multiple epidermal growth factor-like domains protein 11 [Dysidea avara]|uniref:multiple epidermal growth factor-like domains protein 11 n=1 Tax=Dysidea avara TaxID=196820 RepID=UPI00331AFBCF